ncbi:MAG: UDP-glucuronic acid decarboxylase family protein [Patescibacteria group bacterium]
MAKIALVTGGAGFIGSHLCDLLVKRGLAAICVDNLITGTRENIRHLRGVKNFSFLEKDVAKDRLDVKGLDYIFHLASPASPIDYQNHPQETALTNSLGTLKMLELAKRTGAKFLLASTSEVYGDPKEHPQKESYWGNVNSFGPRACYDESKRFAETLVYIYLHKYGIDARIVRIFNTYGPRMQKDDGRAVSNFINQALAGENLTINGKGNQTRSFCYVSDLVSGIYKAMFADKTKGEIFNLGNPDEYRIIDLAKKILKLVGGKSQISFGPYPEDDPQRRKPDISKAKRVLGWQPKISVDEGLQKTIAYYKSI